MDCYILDQSLHHSTKRRQIFHAPPHLIISNVESSYFLFIIENDMTLQVLFRFFF